MVVFGTNKAENQQVRLTDKVRSRLMTKYDRPGLVGVVVLKGCCPKCKGHDFVDVAIHGGKTIRRDCAVCNKFRCFVYWGGKRVGDPAIMGVYPAKT